MNKWIKYGVFIISSIALIVVGLILYANKTIEDKIENFLANRLPEIVFQKNEGIALNIFEGTITIKKLVVEIKNKNNENNHAFVDLEALIIEDISYWDYLFKSEIRIEDIKLKSPNIVYYKDRYEKNEKSDSTSGFIKIYKPILIDELSIDNATFHIYDSKKDSVLLYVENATIEIDAIEINNKTIRQRLPVSFKAYEVDADSIFVKASDFENLSTSNFKLKNNKAVINTIQLKTKFSRKALSGIISKERDHFNLKIESLKCEGIGFGFKNRNLYISSKQININNADFEIFRDKLVNDDESIKKMYSESIRSIPFDLTVDSVFVNEAHIKYTEKVNADNSGGAIDFSKLYAKISNVSNTYKSPEMTNLNIQGVFMEATPFTVDWSFDVNSKTDSFVFATAMDKLELSKINTFTEPNLNVRLEGVTNQTYFTIDGNNTKSKVDLKVNYEDLNISVLSKNGKTENWFLSTVANLFVSNTSKDQSDYFRASQAEVDRDKTKSIFNFIWLNIKQGLLKSMTGDGEVVKNSK
ncbi:hypothetical protein [Lacinutrix sp. Hel_I_90]|uniref:hypothetical protein n=1 Tax=Lacinutrix sp. Hel_I_90 TaxID=1249999 RepID=UPI0005CA0C29|nr:hypothetical protein [Lacinutrix sp. Hel_I_90]